MIEIPRSPTEDNVNLGCEGMTLRDYFAAAALSAYLSSDTALTELFSALAATDKSDGDRRKAFREVLAKRCYLQADAMLAEREKAEANS